jgi:hypothetical protein
LRGMTIKTLHAAKACVFTEQFEHRSFQTVGLPGTDIRWQDRQYAFLLPGVPALLVC